MQLPQIADTETGRDVPGSAGAPAATLIVRRSPRLGALRWLRLLAADRRAALGLCILGFFVLVAIAGPLVFKGDPTASDYNAIRQPPSAAHWFGTDQQGHDMFLQMVDGTRAPLIVGFSVAICATILAVLVGTAAGYIGGWVDEVLSLITNVFLVIPSLPLVVVISSWIHINSDAPIIVSLILTGWAFGARVLRSQTMSVRNKDFVMAAQVSGESNWRIILFEILPNMISIVVSSFIGTALFAIGIAAAVLFIGVGNITAISWFTMLYWAQSNQVFLTGAWWTFVPPGLAIALVGTALALINFGIDTISNPRLRTEGGKSARAARTRLAATPVVGKEPAR